MRPVLAHVRFNHFSLVLNLLYQLSGLVLLWWVSLQSVFFEHLVSVECIMRLCLRFIAFVIWLFALHFIGFFDLKPIFRLVELFAWCLIPVIIRNSGLFQWVLGRVSSWFLALFIILFVFLMMLLLFSALINVTLASALILELGVGLFLERVFAFGNFWHLGFLSLPKVGILWTLWKFFHSLLALLWNSPLYNLILWSSIVVTFYQTCGPCEEHLVELLFTSHLLALLHLRQGIRLYSSKNKLKITWTDFSFQPKSSPSCTFSAPPQYPSRTTGITFIFVSWA